MWRGEPAPQAFQAPVDVHASADGQVYMFKRRPNESAISSDDEELSLMEIKPQGFQAQDQDRLSRNVQLLERKVLDGDNLNKLALQYGCKVADIKRVNNLMQEQDLFGLTSIKIPVHKHSFLMETYSDRNESATTVKFQDRTRSQPHLQEAADFLMEIDNDIEKLIQTTNNQEDVLYNSEKEQKFGVRGRTLNRHGSDWRIQWWNAVVAMLLIGIILPLFYVIYFKIKANNNNNNNVVLPTSSVTSLNQSGTSLSTRGLEHFQEPG
ncbi:lysM and putative peptidoglycan-binding domain-containing protein 4 [Solea solea]|uniref:lysM and putative peptidoglycan-binding domain-containing protein 4 n=1 Tax=Solea solea TaxID=90069 RepID=UPI00272B2005|nr:lysM and putative peptidoglycan-binding domain-containing protein 4 [Solea solea]